jgi:hypothetical protein
MIDKLISKIIEQSLDELSLKNLAIVAPLSATKIDNICKTILGSKGVTVDYDTDLSVSDTCVIYTNVEEDGFLILKNISRISNDNAIYLTQVLSERSISLQVDDRNDPIKIEISQGPIIAILTERDELPKEFEDYFNFTIDISSGEVPKPFSFLQTEECRSQDENDDTLDSSEDSFDGSERSLDNGENSITSDVIFDWRDSERVPDIEGDLALLKDTIFRNDEDNRNAADVYQSGVLQVCRAYLSYIQRAFGYDDEVEAEVCRALVSKDGAYRSVLVRVFNEYQLPDGDTITEDDFLRNEDYEVSYGSLEQFMNDQPLKVRREFLHRILTAYNAYDFDGGYQVDASEIDLSVPREFEQEYGQIIFDLLTSVCWKLESSRPS